jgi:hypothetical protein
MVTETSAQRRFLHGWPAGAVHDDESAVTSLRALIRQFDLDRAADYDPTSFTTQATTRAVAAAGRVLVRHLVLADDHPVRRTIATADAYAAHPTEEAYDAYFDAATHSYPYGAGEGCLKINGSTSCEPGEGCRSGAGSLDQIASAAGAVAVVAAIKQKLGPWLRSGATATPAGQGRS